ncbi:MAG TPA: CinA family protein [Aquihabitans sp.]|nr:CinA family protein [Aquihabitans sp.]
MAERAEEVGRLLTNQGRSIAVAESLTGGMLASELAKAERASDWFRGGVVAYASEVKHDLLDVPRGPVVSEEAALAMATSVARVLGADLGAAVTGVGGPGPQDGEPPGTVWAAVHDRDGTDATLLRLEGDPAEICDQTCAAVLDLVASRLLAGAPAASADR